jgi:RNA polymerase sigma-70 factor (ECF subfamily)
MLAARWNRLAGVREPAIQIVRGRVARPEDAEDLVHEALLRLAGRAVLDAENPGLRSLVVTTACGLAVDGWRRERRHQRLLGRLAPGTAPSPESQVADRSEAAWLAAGLPDLGRMERAAILHAAEGQPVGEIARLLGVGYKAAENALGRARRKLRVRAAAAVVGGLSLLRRLFARPESGQAAVIVPVLAAILLLPATGRGGSPPTPTQRGTAAAPAAPRIVGGPVSVRSVSVAGVSGVATLPPPSRRPASDGGGGRASRAAPPGPQALPVQVAPGPEGGVLLVVGGTPVASQPSTALWAMAFRASCGASAAACPPISVP